MSPVVSQWQSHFTPATRDVSGFYVAGNIGIEDVIMDRVKHYLDADALVSSLFNSIDVIDLPFSATGAQAPRIYLWSGNTLEEHAPTGVGLNEVRVFIGIAWRTGEVKVKPFGQPSISSVVRAVKNVLNTHKQLLDKIAPGGTDQALAMKSRLGAVDFASQLSESGTILLQFDWIYEVTTDLATGEIWNVINAP